MARKQAKKPLQKLPSQNKVDIKQPKEKKKRFTFKLEIASLPWLTPYLPGIILFFITVVIALLTYTDYGIGYDESAQREIGRVTYNYVFNGNQELFNSKDVHYGTGFELPLIIIEKLMNLTDSREIYLMRHLVTHLFFLISALAGYIVIYGLFKNKFIASLGFIMLALAPRIYAHSLFNSKDVPFLSMFLITLCCCQIVFEKNKPWLFVILGMFCGYTTSIRIMGGMLCGFILFFLMIDLATNLFNKKGIKNTVLNIFFFIFSFCFSLYLAWPYLWKNPIGNFLSSFTAFSHFPWGSEVLLNGKYELATKLPWTYFPTWFLITNPEVWLLSGFAGIILIIINFCKRPLTYFRNTSERNFILYLMCFFAPVMAVLILHSVLYDDWRHLYFVYPPFVLMALYFINRMIQTKYKLIVQGICMLQVAIVSFFMINNHPFDQVYFNYFVSHKPEYLRKHYEMDYWGCSVYQGLEHLIETNKNKNIKVFEHFIGVISQNVMLLPKEDRKFIQLTKWEDADYSITNFRFHPYDFPSYKVDYSISILNSTILNIFQLEKDPEKTKAI